jgi:hypothetical protein
MTDSCESRSGNANVRYSYLVEGVLPVPGTRYHTVRAVPGGKKKNQSFFKPEPVHCSDRSHIFHYLVLIGGLEQFKYITLGDDNESTRWLLLTHCALLHCLYSYRERL